MSMYSNEKDNIYMVDLQGFIIESNKFVLKELCIHECLMNKSSSVACENDVKHHYTFKPPFAWEELSDEDQKQVIWLTRFHHGYSWNEGVRDYSEIELIMENITLKESGTSIIYVKGDRKVGWFNVLTKNKFKCLNVEELGYKYHDICVCHICRGVSNKKALRKRHQCSRQNHCAKSKVWNMHNYVANVYHSSAIKWRIFNAEDVTEKMYPSSNDDDGECDDDNNHDDDGDDDEIFFFKKIEERTKNQT